MTDPRDAEFTDFVADHGGPLLRTACLVTGDVHLGEDLLRTALAKASESWAKVRQADHPPAYVRRLMINTYLSRLHRLRSTEQVLEALPEPRSGDPRAGPVGSDEMHQALLRLSPRVRTAVVLCCFEGLSEADAAQLMDCPRGTVTDHVTHGLAALRATGDDLGPAPAEEPVTGRHTSVLTSRLHRLADDLTPPLDVVAQVRAARARHGRQRRTRVTLIAVGTAAAAAVVAVPLADRALNPAVPGEAVAGLGGPSGTAVPPPATAGGGSSLALDRLELQRLSAGVTTLATALVAQGGTVSLTAPADLTGCPKDTGAVSAALGVRLDYSAGSLPGDAGECEWSSGRPAGSVADYFSVGIGFAAGWTDRDVYGVTVNEGCRRDSMPAFTPSAVLDACPLQRLSTQWILYVPDAGGTGVWVFVAVEGENQPLDGPTALAAVVDVAAATW